MSLVYETSTKGKVVGEKRKIFSYTDTRTVSLQGLGKDDLNIKDRRQKVPDVFKKEILSDDVVTKIDSKVVTMGNFEDELHGRNLPGSELVLTIQRKGRT